MALRAALLFASGAPYFVGLAAVALAVLLPTARGGRIRTVRVVLYSAGALLIAVSATPIPMAAYAIAVGIAAFACVLGIRQSFWRLRTSVFLRWSVVAACTAAGVLEARYWLVPRVRVERTGP
jgi:hypothetical protein